MNLGPLYSALRSAVEDVPNGAAIPANAIRGAFRTVSKEHDDLFEARLAWGAITFKWKHRSRLSPAADALLQEYVQLALNDHPMLRELRRDRLVAPELMRSPGAAERDSRLVGRWRTTNNYASQDFRAAHHRAMAFASTGTVDESGSVTLDHQWRAADGTVAGSAVGHGDAGRSQTYWATYQDDLYLISPGSARYRAFRFEVAGDSLLLHADDGTTSYWSRA